MKQKGAEQDVIKCWIASRQELIKHKAAMTKVAECQDEVAMHDVMIENAEAAIKKAEATALEASFVTPDGDLMAVNIPVCCCGRLC